MKWIFKRFIKDYKNMESKQVRAAYGKVSSVVSIVLNVLLFAIKIVIATLSNSVAIAADAINNLSDAGSSVVSLVSFIYSSKPADEEHPYGHERFEYVASMFVAFVILFFAIDLFQTGFTSILNPTSLHFSVPMIVVMVASILIKLYMYSYNHIYGKRIKSEIMQAAATDSLSDVIATSAVLVALIISSITGFALDGYLGILVSILVARAGIEILRDCLNKLVGEKPDPAFIAKMSDVVKGYDGILGVHDIVVHSYGTYKKFMTVHAEVDGEVDILISHDLIDNIEKDVKKNYDVDLVIHLDPIHTNDPMTNTLFKQTKQVLFEIDSRLHLHDFRVVKGVTHNNVIFDVEVPIQFPMKRDELIRIINVNMPKAENGLPIETVITLDVAYSSTTH